MPFFWSWCRFLEKEKKNKFVRHSSGNDKEFTIFDALLECVIKKEEKQPLIRRLPKQTRSPWNIAIFSQILLGCAILAWAGQIIWTDITFYGKDLVTILLGSRVGENISLGINMKLITYLLIGFILFVSSLTIKIYKAKIVT